MSDLPQYTREVLGLGGLNISTDLLVGADRRRLEQLRERADRAGCPCLLLVESEPQKLSSSDPQAAEAAIARMLRVIEAAQILSCTAAAMRITADDTDAALQTVWPRLRKIVDRAERLELNLLVSPMKGLTARAERLTDMIKKVGGFRIGTLPDFQFAFESTGSIDGAVTFLRRITPYASVVFASTADFADPAPGAAPPKPPAKKARPADDEDEDDELATKKAARSPEPVDEPEPAPKGKKKAKATEAPKPSKAAKSKADAKPAKAEVPLADPEDDEEIEELDDASLEDLIADIFKGEGEEPPPPQEPLPVHKAYDLFKMVQAVASVGFDSTIAVDYRGGGDVTLGIRKSQRVLRAALDHAAMSA